ncbi:type I polyketide synthase [Microtetraspora sp. NBRC 16547]|uniref:type I polyketide synthase n=1 Tax=Microtetraspora sp. NBRC 16547 TaxID=3030993 RepID=UPI0024A3CC88|nr:type I polyketide synthase [Microtetraspora sp. NBRC 16547]GLX00439.1 hypothetical protein Misp02_45250 [Microtetraspora sp. NBRC 16547]
MSGGYTGDEIAVVGMAGRFPGAPDVPSLWRNLLDGVDAVHDFTDDELRDLGVDERLIGDPAHVRSGGHLPGVAEFDAEFFGVPSAEAERMDPQQRLFLEQAWAALEDAGCDPAAYDGVVGVFAGSSANRYFLFHLLGNPAATGAEPYDLEQQLVQGAAADYLPAQVAYRLGLTGPAVAVQTACSSSLVAICTAAQNLLDYRCDLALAGGVSITWPRFRHTPGGLISPDGRCRTFDASAQGTVYGSGVAVLALKRLADALDQGDHVLAVLRGWAVNNDGAVRAGFAAPGTEGQSAVVTEALAAAELTASAIGYVEAHGSGTLVGDAIEAAALIRAFGPDPVPGSCALGSIKTNIGNLDAAAGAAGLIKAVLAVRHGVIPASLHYRRPGPDTDFAGSPFFVPVKTQDWEQPGPRRAGVSSFGLGGTNAHVIVEQPPAAPPRPAPAGWHLLTVSARTPQALRATAERLADHLERTPEARLDDVACTLAMGRRAFGHRTAVLCRDRDEAVALLRANDGPSDGPSDGRVDGPEGLRGGDDGPEELCRLAAEWLAGADVDWTALYDDGHRRVSLPAYPFQRKRYWIEALT